ncbi:glutamate racemase [Moorellaceae bacterium AZ2]
MLPEQPVGVFDSGVGGLTVVREIVRQLPAETIIYYGDTAHVPYGSKKVEELIAYADAIVSFLVEQGVKAIVDACNTTSAVALGYLKNKYSLPIIGVIEPGVREALAVTRHGRIGVLATEATIASGIHTRLLQSLEPSLKVYPQACPRLVPLVEAGMVEGPEAREAVAEYVEPLVKEGIDTLLLGCTHYPFLASVIQEVAGEGVTLVDPAASTAQELGALLQQHGALRHIHGSQAHAFLVSGSAESFRQVAQKLVGWPELRAVRHVKLLD